MIIPLMGLAKEDPVTEPPTATVRTIYVGYDMAIIEVRQSRFGNTAIRYAQDGNNSFTQAANDSAGVFHRIVLTNLKGGTAYNFDALVSDMYGNKDTIKDRDDEFFTFTTLKAPPGKAEISNVKVCKVTSDSAEIFWFTPNGSYDSRVVYDTRNPPTSNTAVVQDGNIYGRPTQFHYVKIGGLKEKTTYWFYVESNGTRDDNNRQYYTFTTPVEHVDFDVRAALYNEGGKHFIGLNVINQDVKDYDSLELRLYVRAPDTILVPDPATNQNIRVAFENHFAFRVDIGFKYKSDGWIEDAFKEQVDGLVRNTRPIKMDDGYDPVTGMWAYYVPVPLGNARMESGARFRLDLALETRSPWGGDDLMDRTPLKLLDPKVDWSFMPHSRANGDPADYPGTPTGTKDDIVDRDYWNTPVNQYITVYRKNEFIWGYSPSAKEQQTKKTHYEMTSQVTSPIFNPAEEYLFMEQVVPSITVNGWARVTENGAVNDIWVNGSKVYDVSSVAKYDFASDRWNLTIPVPVKNGGNNIDITIFGGPESECATCYGCAFTNHSFYLEFRGAEPYASSIKLESCANRNVEVKDTARIDTTCFYIFVDDMNGNLTKDRRDTVYVSVVNPVTRDSLPPVPLIETDDSTGKFRSASPVSVVSKPQPQRGPNEIFMDGGQTVVVTYVDPTDPEDISRATLMSSADYPVSVDAWFRDSTGAGSIDLVYVRYTKAFAAGLRPDSLRLEIPGQGDRVVRAPADAIAPDAGDRSLVRFHLDPAIQNVTGFAAGEQMAARSYILYNGTPRQAGVAAVRDSAGPALLGRAMLSERFGGGYDTLQVTLSEPMQGAGMVGGTLILRRGGGADVSLPVVGVIDPVLVTNSPTLIVNPGAAPVREGDSVFIDPKGPAADRAGNSAHPSNRPVPVALKTSAPRITAAAYRDTSADGVIDQVELTVSKALELAGLRLWLAWEKGRFVEVEWSRLSARLSASGAETVVKAEIAGLLTGDSIVTSGSMTAMATHNRFPGDTLRAGVADRAAPVVRWAQYCPALLETDKDTLVVNFSEPLLVSTSKPLRFLDGEGGAQYVMELQNINRKESGTQTFVVSSVENGAGYPGQNDSAWINTGELVYDTSTNIQANPGNRRVKLAIKPAPLAIKVIPAPNPFTPGVRYSGAPPVRIIVRPVSKSAAELNISGTVTIYDKLGNVVLTDTLKTQPGSTDLYYLWDGCNRRGRRAGSGTYLVTASVGHAREAWEEKPKQVTGKAFLYVNR